MTNELRVALEAALGYHATTRCCGNCRHFLQQIGADKSSNGNAYPDRCRLHADTYLGVREVSPSGYCCAWSCGEAPCPGTIHRQIHTDDAPLLDSSPVRPRVDDDELAEWVEPADIHELNGEELGVGARFALDLRDARAALRTGGA